MAEPVVLNAADTHVFVSDTDPIPRDRYGRPLIVPPGGGKPEAYMRATTLAKTLDDTFNLTEWAKRSVLIGAGMRPDLAMSAAILAPTQATDRYAKKEIGKLAETAMEVSGSSTKRNLGTTLHALSERVDRGESMDGIPEELLADLRAYYTATKPLEVTGIEEFIVNDALKTAGTYDRTVRYKGRTYISDLKTGNVHFAAGAIAIQLAVYAGGQRYSHDTGERTPLPDDLDPDWGIVFHLPQSEKKCTLYWVDLKAGREAIEHALWVRSYRKKKDLFQQFEAA